MTQTINVGDRVLFTNPSTGQQLIGTVLYPHCQCGSCRKWKVEFDSYMFREVNTSTAYVEAEYLTPLQGMTMPKQHDPLCRAAPYKDAAQISKDDGVAWCQCDLIAKVRSDQVERDVDKVKAAYSETHVDDWGVQVLYLRSAIDALRGDS